MDDIVAVSQEDGAVVEKQPSPVTEIVDVFAEYGIQNDEDGDSGTSKLSTARDDHPLQESYQNVLILAESGPRSDEDQHVGTNRFSTDNDSYPSQESGHNVVIHAESEPRNERDGDACTSKCSIADDRFPSQESGQNDIISAGSWPRNDKADDAGTPKCSTVDDVYPLQESSQNDAILCEVANLRHKDDWKEPNGHLIEDIDIVAPYDVFPRQNQSPPPADGESNARNDKHGSGHNGAAYKELLRLFADLRKRKQIKVDPRIIRTDKLKISFDKPLGSGGFGTVYIVQLDGEKKPVCAKFIQNDGNSKLQDLIRETSILCFLTPTGCVPQCFGIAKVAHKYPNKYLPYVIVQEIIESGLQSPHTLTLRDLMNPAIDCPKPNWSNLAEILHQMRECVRKRGVVIGDISKLNIMVHWDGKGYIPFFIDMGVTRHSAKIEWIQDDIDALEKITKQFPMERQT